MKISKVISAATSFGQRAIAACAALTVMAGEAVAGPTLPSGGGDLFVKARAWFQQYTDFMTGPFGYAVVAIGIVVALAVYAIAPKEGIMGPALRVVIAGIGIINVITVLGSFS